MRILKLKLTDFGRHRDLDVSFAPGFTIVRGPNEAGKSTIQRAIELALFRKATATGSELESLRSWGVADSRLAARMEFTVSAAEDGGVPGPDRPGLLEKEFRGQRGQVRLELDGQTVTDPARADAIVAELTGIPNEGFFRSTASIRHEELDDLDRDEGSLRDRLQGSVGGGDRGSSRAKSQLEDAIRALRARGEKNPGRLKIAEEAVARAETALQGGEGALEKLERDRDALAQARAARMKTEQSLAESRNLLEGARQADRVVSEKAVLEERYERLRQVADAQEQIEKLESAPELPIATLREMLEKMRTMQGRVDALKEALDGDTAPDVEADESIPGYLPLAGAAGVGVILAIVAIGLALASGAVALLGTAAVLLVFALILILMLVGRWSTAHQIARANDERSRVRAIRRQSRVGTEEGFRVAQSGVNAILRDLGVSTVAQAEALLSGEQGRQQEIATLQAQVSALMGSQSDEDVEAIRDRVALDIEQKSAALNALGPIATDARARERLEAEVRERQEVLERARDGEAAAAARLDANSVDAEQVAGEAERLATWREQLAALRRRVRVYEKTLAAIEAAEATTMKKATRFLEQQVGSDIARLTGGRYRRVAIDDRTLDIDVWAPERQDWVSATQLSKGTVDQIYLAARIGLVRLVTQGRKPPLILDDPFVTFDDQRAARAALLLRQLASDFQIIYLACSSRYDGLADAVIELAGPTETDPTLPEAGVTAVELGDESTGSAGTAAANGDA